MYVLGISCHYHDASAALLKDGKVVAAAAEERFTRKKHDTSFPMNSIRYCLESQGITMRDINCVGFYEKPLLKFERLLHQHLDAFPRSYRTFLSSMPSWLKEKLRVRDAVKKKLKHGGELYFVEHHTAHAASFLLSPFRRAAILTADGVGEWTTTSLGLGENNEIRLMKEIRFPHSLGLLYSAITAYLGFEVNDAEYKVMGLGAYGDGSEYYGRLKKLVDVRDDGSYSLDMSYFRYHYSGSMHAKKLCKLLGPARKPNEVVTKRHADIAAAVQRILEEAVVKMLNHLYEMTGRSTLVFSGGLALNSVCNGKILRRTPFKNIWIPPDPGDGGSSVGAAAFVYHSILEKKRNFSFTDALLGPGYSTAEIRNFLERSGIKYSEFASEKELVQTAARLIYENKTVGWFQGRMEFGPRALGSRSILANPCNPGMKETLNRIKRRERFRPFAPAVRRKDSAKFFKFSYQPPADFMLLVCPVREKYRDTLPAVTHADGTARLQTVRKSQRLFYDLIGEFGKLSGVPVLLNTSFNVRGEPIVCSPADAYRCMTNTGIECMFMDRFLVRREENILSAGSKQDIDKRGNGAGLGRKN